MRCFDAGEGRVLVEWAPSATDVVKPDRSPVETAWTYYLLDAAGEVARTWTTSATAVQEHLSTTAHVIEGDELVSYFHDVAWGHEDEPSLSRSVELAGLRPVPPKDAPSEAAVQEAIDRAEEARRAAWARHEQVESERLQRFERALPPLEAGERITLVWRYAGRDVVISRSTGEEVWREPDWPWTGKELHRRLSRVATDVYGDRLDAFLVDVPADEYLRFDND